MQELKERKQELLETIRRTKEYTETRATRINKLIEAQRKWMGRELNASPVKEPILFLGRRNGTFELYEQATKGILEFKHSNGEKRFIIIDPTRQNKFGIGKDQIRGYWAHEDHPVTGYPDPVITTEQVNIHAEKLMNDIRNWMAKSKEATGLMFLYIGAGVALVIIAVMLLKQASPPPGQVINVIAPIANETAKTVVAGAMGIINNTPPI